MFNYKEWLLGRKQFNSINKTIQHLTEQQIQIIVKIYQNSDQVIFFKDKIRLMPRYIKPWVFKILAIFQKYKTNYPIARFRRYNNLSQNKRRSSSLYNHILKYNKNIALQKFNEKNEKCRIDLNFYIKNYGQQLGKEKWNEHLEKIHVGKAHYIKKYGNEQGLKKYKEHCQRCSENKSLQRMIELYGENKGLKRYNEVLQKSKYYSSKEFYLDKYGQQQGDRKWNQKINKLHFGSSKEGFIAKYGQDNIDKIIKDNKDHFSLKFFKKKYGEQLGLQKFKEMCDKRSNALSHTSQQSIKLFKPYFQKLLTQFKQNQLYLGKVTKQFYLNYGSGDDVSHYFYDFTILPLKLIFEYNGQVYHTRQNMDNEYYQKWEKTYNKITGQNITYLDMLNKDKHKKQIAQKNGFTVFYIWQNDSNKEEIINNVLKEKGIII